MADRWIIIPNWDKFQHYRDRRPPWIKLYTQLLDKDEWRHLTLAQQGLLINIWMLYASSGGLLEFQSSSSRVPQKVPRKSIEALVDAGFIEVVASKPLAKRSIEGEGERETPYPLNKNGRPRGRICPHCGLKTKGPRSLAEHLANVHYDAAQTT